MARTEHFYFASHAPGRQIHGVRWLPEGQPRAVLQITHGMVEYIERYQDFAQWLNERGFLVTGHDHLGHGNSIRTKADYGYFADEDANGTVLADVHRLTQLTKESYPGCPISFWAIVWVPSTLVSTSASMGRSWMEPSSWAPVVSPECWSGRVNS